MKKLAAIVSGMVVASAVADVSITGDYLIDTDTAITERVTGSGRFVVANGATLTLGNGSNNFLGGILVSNGVVNANASNCLGSGDIVFSNTSQSDASGARQVFLNVKDGTWPNNFIFRDNDVVSGYPGICATKTCTLTGSITANDTDSRVLFITATDSTTTLTIEGAVSASKLYDRTTGCIVMKGKVTATSFFQHGHEASANGTLELWNPENKISRLIMKMGSVECKAENVLYGASLFWAVAPWNVGGNLSQLRLNGYNQSFSMIYDNTDQIEDARKIGGRAVSIVTPDDQPAKVTVIGTASASTPTTMARIFGPVDIVGDVTQSSTLVRFRWMTNDGMTGTLATSNTTLYLARGVSFPNAVALVVAADGRFYCESVTNAVSGLTKIDIAGSVYCDKGCVEPINAPNAEMNLTSDAVLQFSAGVTNTVGYLVVDGKYKAAGVYTKSNLAQMCDEQKPSDATAALVVLKGRLGLSISIR